MNALLLLTAIVGCAVVALVIQASRQERQAKAIVRPVRDLSLVRPPVRHSTDHDEFAQSAEWSDSAKLKGLK